MFLREFVEVVFHHVGHHLLHLVVRLTLYLQHQTLLQRVRTYARRVESLQYGHYAVNVFGCHVDVVVYGQLVAYALRVLAQQSVVVERADDIFHHLRVLFAQVGLPHLLLQLVIERCGVAVNLLLILRAAVLVAVIQRRHLVVAAYVLQRAV